MASANPTEFDLPSDSDHDSTFGDDESVLTASLTPSVLNFRFEYDRRYHAYSETKYPIPNDEIESDRLDFQHRTFLLTLDGKLYRAPIRHYIQHVLDVGTGTGIWAMEFCDLHPSAQVIGTDLSPIQPREVPVNCEFLIDDCEEEWLFRKHFELIHARAMLLSIKNWPRFFEQAYAHLVPGGYLELQEITYPAMCMDTSLSPETSPMLRWSSLFVEAATRLGLDATAPRYFGQMLHDAGFVDIRLKIYTWPVGKWAKGEKWKTLGEYAQSNLMDWLGGGSLWLFTKMLGWSRIKLELFLAEVRRELRDRTERQFYAHVYFWYARKPDIGEAWNPTATPFILEESIELEVDEEATAGSAASSTTPSSALTLKSPVTSLVIPATELSLASPRTASRSTTPKQSEAPRRSMYISDEEDDSSENSTIQTPSDEGTSAIAFPKTSVNGMDTRKDSGPVAADAATASDAGKTVKGKEANSGLPNAE